MDKNVLLSKIAATPGENTWSQAYSTLNLYIVLSIKSEAEDGATIVNEGKELFERIQREYFSLDKKDLKNIKQAVEQALAPIEDKSRISVVLTTISEDVLYIVIASGGTVVLKRDGKLGVIAQGEPNEVAAFSGEIRHDDIIILETTDFTEKIPVDKLSELVGDHEISEISESLTPIIHEEAKGSEAAIILQYKNSAQQEEVVSEPAEDKEKPTEEEIITEKAEKKEEIRDDVEEGFRESDLKESSRKMPSIKLPTFFKGGGKKKFIAIAIVVLVIVLAGSIFFERSRQESRARQEVLAEIIEPAQAKFEEAEALADLNKGLALDEFNKLKSEVEQQASRLAQGTPERKELDEFIGRIEGRIGELSSGSTLANQQVIFEDSTALVQFKEGGLVAVSSDGKVYLLSGDGEVEDEYESENGSVDAVAADENYVYLVGSEGITRTAKNNGNTTTIVDDPDTTVALDTFGSNLYGLNTTTKMIDKYTGSSYARSDYLSDDVELDNPVSMAIDSSIWVIDDGKVRKFTRGEEDSFNVSGLSEDFSSESQIFTSIDYENVYVLDKNTGRIVQISKDGEVQNQYVSGELSGASSFAVDEEGEKIFVVISNKLYSFDL